MDDLKNENLFTLKETIAKEIFKGHDYPWEIIPFISDFILRLGRLLPEERYVEVRKNIWIAKNAMIAPTACINGPVIIDEGAEIRHCAFIRGSAVIGKQAVVGNSTEIKNAILFNGVQVPHFNYVGDSILGYRAHMGAGAVTSNVKSDHSSVTIQVNKDEIVTGLEKLGAALGDFAEIGCNSVLNPGSVIGRHSTVYPTSMIRGFVPSNSIYKSRDKVIKRS